MDNSYALYCNYKRDPDCINRLAKLVVGITFLLSATAVAQPQEHSDSSHLAPVTSLQFVEPPKQPQPPDYIQIRKDSDARIAADNAQEAAQAAQQARDAQLAAQQQQAAQIASTPVTMLPSGNCVIWLQQLGVMDITDAMLVINRESGCNPYAHNPSGACGIGQDINGCEVGYDPIAQLQWMINYVNSRYNGFAGAWAHELSMGWY